MKDNRIPSVAVTVAAALLAAAGATPATAARILYLDAAAPGQAPEFYWADLSASAYDFIATGSPLPAHVDNPGEANDYFDMDRSNGFVGTGDESIFDFETERAGAGLGTPFSINLYFQITDFGPDKADQFVSKTDGVGGDGQFAGFMYKINADRDGRMDFMLQPGNNNDRTYHRTDNPAFNGTDVMMTVTHDGSGSSAGLKQYYNGSEALNIPFSANDLNGSILTDEQVRIGIADAVGGQAALTEGGVEANVYIIEIYDHILTAQEVSDRWNNGSPARATTSPARPAPFVIDSVALSGGTGLEFSSLIGETYVLQFNLDTNTSDWVAAGLTVEETGGTMLMIDPAGYDSNKTYRVLRQ
jgi:hypothetical protein